MDTILFIVLLCIIIFIFFIRNSWVYHKRSQLLNFQSIEIYLKLPSYYNMLWKFWIWDINKFIGE